jgi:hypothetical protein
VAGDHPHAIVLPFRLVAVARVLAHAGAPSDQVPDDIEAF